MSTEHAKRTQGFIKRTVTLTRVQFGTVVVENGVPDVKPHEDIFLAGAKTKDQASKLVKEQYGDAYTVFNVEPETNNYKMDLLKFVEHATVLTDGESLEEEEAEEVEEA